MEAGVKRTKRQGKPPVMLRKLGNGCLAPASERDAERLKRFKPGADVSCELKLIRNGSFHRKYFALLNFIFGIWEETMPRRRWRNHEVRASFERFREDIIILTGRFDAIYNIQGEVRMEAHSISFARMEQEEFEALYSQTIDVALQKVLNRPDLDEATVRRTVDDLLRYD